MAKIKSLVCKNSELQTESTRTLLNQLNELIAQDKNYEPKWEIVNELFSRYVSEGEEFTPYPK